MMFVPTLPSTDLAVSVSSWPMYWLAITRFRPYLACLGEHFRQTGDNEILDLIDVEEEGLD